MMEKFPNVVSPEGEESKEDAIEALKQWRKEGMEPIEGEKEKTERESAYIETINTFISRLFEGLEIEKLDNQPLLPEQIHILPEELYKKKFPKMVGKRGFYSSINNAIYIDDGCRNPDESLEEISKFETLLHESLHLVSHQKFYVKQNVVNDYRVGYRMGDINEKGRDFEGLNEGIVSITEIDIIRSFADELEEKFGFTKDEIEGPVYAYHKNQGLVFEIVEQISEYKDEDSSKSLQKIIKGHFTGEMMHLRDIEKIYGEGSLNVLARYGSRHSDKSAADQDEMILEYFQTDNSDRREKIKKEILD